MVRQTLVRPAGFSKPWAKPPGSRSQTLAVATATSRFPGRHSSVTKRAPPSNSTNHSAQNSTRHSRPATSRTSNANPVTHANAVHSCQRSTSSSWRTPSRVEDQQAFAGEVRRALTGRSVRRRQTTDREVKQWSPASSAAPQNPYTWHRRNRCGGDTGWVRPHRRNRPATVLLRARFRAGGRIQRSRLKTGRDQRSTRRNSKIS